MPISFWQTSKQTDLAKAINFSTPEGRLIRDFCRHPAGTGPLLTFSVRKPRGTASLSGGNVAASGGRRASESLALAGVSYRTARPSQVVCRVHYVYYSILLRSQRDRSSGIMTTGFCTIRDTACRGGESCRHRRRRRRRHCGTCRWKQIHHFPSSTSASRYPTHLFRNPGSGPYLASNPNCRVSQRTTGRTSRYILQIFITK